MSTFNPRTFTTPGIFESIKSDLLVRFFGPYRNYFDEIGVTIPAEQQHETFEHRRVIEALTEPNTPPPPPPLVEAMCIIDDLANEHGADALERELTRENPGFRRPDEIEDANFALVTWLENPALVERVTFRTFALEGRSYLSFKLDAKYAAPARPPGDLVEGLKEQVRARFAHVYPMESFRIRHVADDNGGRFVIRHGGPLVREGIVSNAAPEESETALFRRELFDIVIFAADVRELRIHARSKRDCDLYTRAFGACAFDDEDAFPDADKYTLNPLVGRREGFECGAIAGLRRVRLTEFTIGYPGTNRESVTRRARDIFQMAAIRNAGIPSGGMLTKARFEVSVANAARPRTVAIHVPNKAQYKRDTDGEIVEQWLRATGFVLDSTVTAATPAADAAPAP